MSGFEAVQKRLEELREGHTLSRLQAAALQLMLAEVDRLKAELAVVKVDCSFWEAHAQNQYRCREEEGSISFRAALAAERANLDSRDALLTKMGQSLRIERKRAERLENALQWYDAADHEKGFWCPVIRQFAERHYSSGSEQCLGCKEWFDHEVHPDALEQEFVTRIREALRPAAPDATSSEKPRRIVGPYLLTPSSAADNLGSEQPDLPLDVEGMERDCQYRSDLPGNTGPACLRCPSCRRYIEGAKS